MISVLILFDAPVHGIQHFDGDEDRQGHSHGVRVMEYGTVNAFEFLGHRQTLKMVSELPVTHARSIGGNHVPPCRGANSCTTDIAYKHKTMSKCFMDMLFL